jgi:hypothetical protein
MPFCSSGFTSAASTGTLAAQGLGRGVMVTLLTIVLSALNDYAVYKLPHMLVVKYCCVWQGAGSAGIPDCSSFAKVGVGIHDCS